MRSHGHLWLFILLVFISFDGPGANAADPDPGASAQGEAGPPVTVAAPAALPACPWTPADIGRADHDGVPTAVVAAASGPAPCLSGLRFQAFEWLGFGRPFAETVSYRTTAPPSRIA